MLPHLDSQAWVKAQQSLQECLSIDGHQAEKLLVDPFSGGRRSPSGEDGKAYARRAARPR
jgi:hypothetical protein